MPSWLRGLLWFVGVVGAIGGLFYAFVLDVWTVHADDPVLAASIAPTLEPGDVVLFARGTGVDHNHLARCDDPDAPGRYVVGRAQGRAGDQVEVTGDKVHFKGRLDESTRTCPSGPRTMTHPATGEPVTLGCYVESAGGMSVESLRDVKLAGPPRTFQVGAGEVVLASDNRALHLDARDFGPVRETSCHHVLFRLWGKGGPLDGSRRFALLW